MCCELNECAGTESMIALAPVWFGYLVGEAR